jgi:hypothetical protein
MRTISTALCLIGAGWAAQYGLWWVTAALLMAAIACVGMGGK